MATLPVLNQGVQLDILTEATTGSGSTSRDIVIQSDALLCLVAVDSVAGSLDVQVYTLVGNRELLVLEFPSITSPIELTTQYTGPVGSTLRVRATYSSSCSYKVQCRAIGDSASASPSVSNQQNALALLTNANWMKLGDFEQISPVFDLDRTTYEYLQDGAIIGRAILLMNSAGQWDLFLERYINDADGDQLLDDDDQYLFLD